MNLPNHLSMKSNWILVGPMGPTLNLTADAVMAVDGGLEFAPDPDFWVGDGDSNPSLPLPDHFLKLSPTKDYSDLKASLDFLTKANCIHLWGFLGGRRDHELAVLGECHAFLKMNPLCQIMLYEDGILKGIFLPAKSGSFDHQGDFSFLTLEKTKISLTGELLYPLPAPQFINPLSSHGISNKAKGLVHYESEGPFLVLFGEF
jgi:thiamine pyrophosphokinase